MKAKDFNNLTEKYILEKLESFGFKKSGVHFYLHESPNIMVLHKKTHRVFFEGFFVAFTHDFLENTKDANGNMKIPTSLEEFPISIPLELLKKQYRKYKKSTDFNYDLNFLTREVLTSRKFTSANSSRFLDFEKLLINDIKAEEYIRDSIEIVNDLGLRFFSEFNTQITYKTLTKFPSIDDRQINKYLEEVIEYMTKNNIEIPKRKRGLVSRLFK